MMKTKYVILAGALCLALSMCACSPKESKQTGLSTAADDVFTSAENMSHTDIVSSNTFETVQNEGIFFTQSEPGILTYYDFKSENRYPFCSDINCSHEDDSCNAWIDGSVKDIFLIDSKLCFLEEDEESTKINWMSMNPDGTNRKVVASLEPEQWGAEVLYPSGTAWMMDGKVFTSIQCTTEENGESFEQAIQMDTKSGQITQLLPGHSSIVTMYKNYILYTQENHKTPKMTQEEFFKKNGSQADYDAYESEWMRNSYRLKYLVYDIKTGRSKEVCQMSNTPELDESALTDEGKFYMVSGKEIWCIDLVQGKREKIYSGEEELTMQCADAGKVFVMALDDKREKVHFYGYYDVKNAQMQKLDKNILGSGGWIINYNKDYYIGTGKVHGKYGDVCVKKSDYMKSNKNAVIMMRKEES